MRNNSFHIRLISAVYAEKLCGIGRDARAPRMAGSRPRLAAKSTAGQPLTAGPGHCRAWSHLESTIGQPLRAWSHLELTIGQPLRAWSHLELTIGQPLRAWSHLESTVGQPLTAGAMNCCAVGAESRFRPIPMTFPNFGIQVQSSIVNRQSSIVTGSHGFRGVRRG